MKYLIVGLGNIGYEYNQTRHNIGFEVLDALAKASNIVFTDSRRAYKAELKHKGRTLILIKPTTFMNLSGKAVNYWVEKENIPLENVLIIADDLALPFGTLRIKPKGSDAGHNGLKSINEHLGTNAYPRLRFGIGDTFSRGKQVDYVLGKWDEMEQAELGDLIDRCLGAIKDFPFVGIQQVMNQFNNK